MAVDPYTLNSLYSQGILDYVPYELCGGANVSAMIGMQNPYLNSAKQGALYQQSGVQSDSFNSVSSEITGINSGVGINTGVNTRVNAGAGGTGLNAYTGMSGINSSASGNMTGFNTFGNETAGYQGLNGLGQQGTDIQTNQDFNTGNGLNNNIKSNLTNGAATAEAIYNKTPSFVKGIAAAAIMFGSVAMLLRGKKKVPPPQKNTASRFNPVNWFKRNKV